MTDDQINQRIAELTNCAGHGNYCADLNAMHEAEKVLTVPQEKDYFANLEEIVGDLIWFRSSPKSHRATAKERAEAFLRTLGKWEEVQG